MNKHGRHIVLDTNRYRDLAAKVPDATAAVEAAGQIFIPFVVLGELRAGFRNGTRERENEAFLRTFLAAPGVQSLFADQITTEAWATLNVYLRRRGRKIPSNDLWIAALCVQHGLHLYSRDTHFDEIPQVMRVDA